MRRPWLRHDTRDHTDVPGVSSAGSGPVFPASVDSEGAAITSSSDPEDFDNLLTLWATHDEEAVNVLTVTSGGDADWSLQESASVSFNPENAAGSQRSGYLQTKISDEAFTIWRIGGDVAVDIRREYGTANGIVPVAIVLTGLPVDDPEIAGMLWNDGGTLKVSAG